MKLPARVAVLASGGGTNLQALIDRFNPAPAPAARVELVVASRPGIGALERAERAGIASLVLDDAAGDLGARMLEELERHRIDIVVLAGWLRLVPAEVVARYRGRMLNVHPALLPGFGGKGMYGLRVHRAVIDSGARVSGATVHLVDDRYDEGTIVAQWPVPILPGDTPEALAARVLPVEHLILPLAVEALAMGEGPPAAPTGPLCFDLAARRPRLRHRSSARSSPPRRFPIHNQHEVNALIALCCNRMHEFPLKAMETRGRLLDAGRVSIFAPISAASLSSRLRGSFMSTTSDESGMPAEPARPASPAWLHLALFLAWIGIGTYWFLTFSGPFRWLAELQNAWFGAHSRLLSSAIPVIVGWVVSEFVASRLLGTRMLGKDEDPLESLAGLKRLAPVAVLAGGLLFAGLKYRKVADAGTLLAATPAELAPYADRAALYLRLTGAPDARLADDGEGNVYVPVRAVGTGAEDAVPVLVAIRDHEVEDFMRSGGGAYVTAEGMATHGVDAELRRFFEQGGLRFTEDPWVLRTWHETPGSMLTGVWFIAGLTLAAAVVVFLVQRAEARSAAQA